MKLKQSALAVALIVAAGSASAASIDFRHEYRASIDYKQNDGTEKSKDSRQASRIKLNGTSIKIDDKRKFSYGVEVKFQSDDTSKLFDHLYIYETEFDLGITQKLDKNWYIQYGMPINFAFDEPLDNDDKHFYLKKVTYKPQFRVGYKADMGLTTTLRYRHEFADFRHATMGSSQNGDTNSQTGKKELNPQKMKITYTGSYKIKSLKKLSLAWEGNYVKSLDHVLLYDSKDWEWDFGVKVGYKFGKVTTFGEIWTVDVDSKSDQREAKYRLGVKYSF